MPARVYVSAAVEGVVDEAVARRLIEHANGVPGPVFGKHGKPALRARLNGYNNAAKRAPWIVLVDLNGDFECAAPLREAWIPEPANGLCFRVAVRAVEAWLLADANTMARFLGVSRTRIPTQPEALPDPKREVVNLARGSRRRALREDMVPREGSGRTVGPAYSSRIIEFVSSTWRPDVAAKHAESLRRSIACLSELISENASRLVRH